MLYGIRIDRYLDRMEYALLLSGGVDSSTALAELVTAGHTVHAFYLKVWLEDELDHLGACPWEEDLTFASAVCGRYGVALTVVPLQLAYHEAVVTYTLDELRRGRTPSPDLFCNERIKFGAFFDYLAGRADIDPGVRIASGHYAMTREADDHVELVRSPDPVKDQTYFLSHLRQEQVARISFPVGSMTKSRLRARARELQIPSQDRRDSQGICFLGKIRYPDFIRHYLGERTGRIVETESRTVLGDHRGYWFYTIGQRQGLGLAGGPWYVVGKEIDSNTLFVSHSNAAERAARSTFEVSELSWIWHPPLDGTFLVKLRHGPQLRAATIEWSGADTISVSMEEPDRGVAPGQFAVFYDGEVCLGSGKIQEATVCTC